MLVKSFGSSVPFVRHVQIVPFSHIASDEARIAPDHRIFFVLSGELKMRLNCVEHALEKYSLAYIPSGTLYSFFIEGGEGDSLLAYNFDYVTAPEKNPPYLLPTAINPRTLPSSFCLEQLAIQDASVLNREIVLHDGEKLQPYFQNALIEYASKEIFYPIKLGSELKLLLASICRMRMAQPEKANAVSANEILAYLRANYAQNIKNENLGERFHYHPMYINRMIRKLTGQSTHQYLVSLRIDAALSLLQGSDKRVEEIAELTGFASASYFTQYFKKITGHLPSDYRNQRLTRAPREESP